MNYTTKEQSKHLIELGLDVKTADMYYPEFDLVYTKIPSIMDEDFYLDSDIPAWSLTALMEIMPENCDVTKTKNGYTAGYVIPHKIIEWEGKTPVDAAYNLICDLIENNYIKVKGN